MPEIEPRYPVDSDTVRDDPQVRDAVEQQSQNADAIRASQRNIESAAQKAAFEKLRSLSGEIQIDTINTLTDRMGFPGFDRNDQLNAMNAISRDFGSLPKWDEKASETQKQDLMRQAQDLYKKQLANYGTKVQIMDAVQSQIGGTLTKFLQAGADVFRSPDAARELAKTQDVGRALQKAFDDGNPDPAARDNLKAALDKLIQTEVKDNQKGAETIDEKTSVGRYLIYALMALGGIITSIVLGWYLGDEYQGCYKHIEGQTDTKLQVCGAPYYDQDTFFYCGCGSGGSQQNLQNNPQLRATICGTGGIPAASTCGGPTDPKGDHCAPYCVCGDAGVTCAADPTQDGAISYSFEFCGVLCGLAKGAESVVVDAWDDLGLGALFKLIGKWALLAVGVLVGIWVLMALFKKAV